MKKEWYIEIDGKEEGPFSIQELKKDSRITAFTPVRKKGTSTFAPLWTYEELSALLEKKRKKRKKDEEEDEEESDLRWTSDGILTTDSSGPGPFLDFLFLVLIFVLLWIIYQVFQK